MLFSRIFSNFGARIQKVKFCRKLNFGTKIRLVLIEIILLDEWMWNSDANNKIADLIEKDPSNTICEKTRWWNRWAWEPPYRVKCTTKPFEGLDCDNFKHEIFFDVNYQYGDQLARELSIKSRIDIDSKK